MAINKKLETQFRTLWEVLVGAKTLDPAKCGREPTWSAPERTMDLTVNRKIQHTLIHSTSVKVLPLFKWSN